MPQTATIKKGFSSAQLKTVAVITMTLDHIHLFLAEPLSIPFWFTLLGRIAAPLFLFCVAKGVFYTHDRRAYAFRLYAAAVLMGVGNWILNHFWGVPRGIPIQNHIFSTLFYVVFFLTVLEGLRSSDRVLSVRLRWIGLLLLPFLLAAGLALLPEGWVRTLLELILPSPFGVEGGFFWIMIGIGLFYTMGDRTSLILFYTAVSLLFFGMAAMDGLSLQNLFIANPQWFMIAALPWMLRYNEQRGRSRKWFFYIYYPAHVYLLAALAWHLS